MTTIFLGALFDLPHVLYIILSLLATIIIIRTLSQKMKTPSQKNKGLLFFGLITFFLHISILWYDFFRTGQSIAPDNVIFPIYFCNMSMYLLLFVSLVTNKNSKWMSYLLTITAYSGIFGALISLFYPSYYLGAEGMLLWPVFKSMLSHSTMLIGCLWILVSKMTPIKVSNAVVYFIGLLGFGLIGIVVNSLFRAFDLYAPNAMYLQHPPLSDVPFLNVFVISFLMVLFIFIFTHIYDSLVNPKEQRWYKQIKSYSSSK